MKMCLSESQLGMISTKQRTNIPVLEHLATQINLSKKKKKQKDHQDVPNFLSSNSELVTLGRKFTVFQEIKALPVVKS